MTFQEYSKQRICLEKQISGTFESQLREERKVQEEIEQAMRQLRDARAKSDILSGRYEQERKRIRENITRLDLEYTEHGG